MFDFLSSLPTLPFNFQSALILSALLLSILAAGISLILNRRRLKPDAGEMGDMGALLENPSAALEHVYELRVRLIRSLLGVAVGTAIAGILTEETLVLLAEPVGGMNAVQAIRVTESFGVFFRVAITLGIILASPFVISQIWIFIASGLKNIEQRYFYLMFPFAIILFLSGVAFAYVVMLPVAVPFLVGFMNIRAIPTLEDYVKFVTNVLLWVGVSFEMPLVIFALAKLGIVNAAMLVKNWRIAIVLIAILSAVVTPTPDPINMAIVSAPLIVLYIISIVLTLFA